MSDVRLVNATIPIIYDLADTNPEKYEIEFDQMSELNDDPIGQWLKTARARGDAADSDPVVLNLLVELYRKIDRLEQILTTNTPQCLILTCETMIESIGYEHFKIKEDAFETGKLYYARVKMPVHPKRDIAIFFEAVDERLAKIIRIHHRDENEWAAYLTARERALIRQLKGLE